MAGPQNVFITGANRGIGLELVKEIVQKFAPQHLFATYRNEAQAKELFEEAGRHSNIHPIKLDVTDFARYGQVVQEVDEITGGNGINLLINNSGILDHSKQSLADTDAEVLLSHFNVNSVSPILLSKAFFPLLKRAANSKQSAPLGIGRAAIVNISTLMASNTDNSTGSYYAYRMSKAALNIGTKSLSIDLKNDNIISVVVHPGWVQTDMGGKQATLPVEMSVNGIVNVLASLNGSHNGKFLNFDGKELPW